MKSLGFCRETNGSAWQRSESRIACPSTHSAFPQPSLRPHRASLATMRDAPGPSPPTLRSRAQSLGELPPRLPEDQAEAADRSGSTSLFAHLPPRLNSRVPTLSVDTL